MAIYWPTPSSPLRGCCRVTSVEFRDACTASASCKIPKHATGYGDDQHCAGYQNTLQVMETTSIVTHYRLWRRPALCRIPKHTTGYGDDQHCNTRQVIETRPALCRIPKHTTDYRDDPTLCRIPKHSTGYKDERLFSSNTTRQWENFRGISSFSDKHKYTHST